MNDETSHGGSGFIGLIILIAIGIFVFNAVTNSNKWTAVYESPTSTMAQSGGEFDSKSDCLNWLNSERLKADGNYNFECGRDCEPPKSINGLYTCQETVDK